MDPALNFVANKRVSKTDKHSSAGTYRGDVRRTILLFADNVRRTVNRN